MTSINHQPPTQPTQENDMANHYNPDATDGSGWLQPYCGADDDGTTSSIGAVSCWKCCAVLGMSGDRIVAQCGSARLQRQRRHAKLVLRAFGMFD